MALENGERMGLRDWPAIDLRRVRLAFSRPVAVPLLVAGMFSLWLPGEPALSQSSFVASDAIAPATPDRALAGRLLPQAGSIERLERLEDNPQGWAAIENSGTVGLIASTWEIAESVGYSGRPIDILVGITQDAKISGAELMRHNEPVLTLGISSEDIARYVAGFAGYDLTAPKIEAFKDSRALPPIIAGATVSTGVIRDAILRTARTVAVGRGLIKTASQDIDRVSFSEANWEKLAGDGSITQTAMTFNEAGRRFGAIAHPLPQTDGTFIAMAAAILDPPTIGRNLLGQQAYTRAVSALAPGDTALMIASSGAQSHRGTSYRKSGIFELIEIIQNEKTIRLKKEDYLRIDRLALAGAPEFKEISVFRLGAETGLRASEAFRIEVTAEREREDGSPATLRIPLTYKIPQHYINMTGAAEAAAEDPLWLAAWQRKPLTIAFTAMMIIGVAGSFFVQEFFVRRPKLWLWGRLGFLALTVVFLGGIAKGQLSVVQVVAFLHSLLNGFRWETFLIEPVIFVLWGFVALGLLFWGRGAYCGWLCPFGALQEVLNEGAKRLGVRQIEVPFAIQERLWAIKYTLFVVILGLSFYSMEKALILAEVEPFKTAISFRFVREWPFVLFAVGLLAAGLFIERFYCRYLCPLGAALAIPAKLKLFDWLHRRPQCGSECRFCETQCTVGAIDTLGRINPNECILCLRCQVIMNDEAQCVVLKRRAARHGGASAAAAKTPVAAPPPM